MWSKLKLNLFKWLREYILLHAMVLIYFTALVTITLIRHYSFLSSTWDLGIFSQAFHNTLRGKIFSYNVELYANPNGCIFGVHFSPILFLILPFFAVFPMTETLLIIQTFALAIGAYPVFFLAHHFFKDKKIALSFSLLYLVFPHTLSVNIFDFHPDIFFVPLSLFSLYYFAKKQWKLYFSFMLLSFSAKEFAALMFAMFALGDLWLKRREVSEVIKKKCLNLQVLVPILTLIAAILWFVMAKSFIRFFNPSSPSGFREGSPWIILGANPIDPSTWMHFNPLNVLRALNFDFQLKVFYLVTLLGPLCFLPLFKISRFIPVLFWFSISFLSNYSPYYDLGFHYSAMLIPFCFLAAIEGLLRLSHVFKGNTVRLYRISKRLMFVGVFSALIIITLALPIRNLNLSLITEHDVKVHQVLAWLKNEFPNASVLTQYNIFPHVSDMANSAVIPPLFLAFNRTYYFEYVNSLFDANPEFIMLDLNPDIKTDDLAFTFQVAFKNIYENGNYGLYTSIDGILVYKYDYSGDLTVFEPFTIRVDNTNYTDVIDHDTTFFSYALPPGIYEITYHAKIAPRIPQQVFTLEVRQGNTILSSVDISGSDFQENEYQNVTVENVVISNPFKEVSFLVTNLSSSTEISVDFVEISITEHAT